MSRLRILLLGPDCDPERVSIPFVTYCHAAALAKLHDVTLVARGPVEDALRRAKALLSCHRSGPDAIPRAHLCLEFAMDLQI